MKIEEKVNSSIVRHITLMNLGMWPVAEVRAVRPQRMASDFLYIMIIRIT